MFDRRHVRWSLIALLLLAGCSLGVTPEPLPTRSESPRSQQTAGLAQQVCESDPFGCAEVAEGDPILIGTALTLTGPDAARGLDSQFGAQVALNLRGSVLGHAVELVNHDDRCGPNGGTAAASRLMDLGGLVAVIGTSCSSAAGPAAALLGQRGILLVSPSNTAPRPTPDDGSESFYARIAPNDAIQARTMARFACTEVAVTTAATIGDGSAYSEALQEAFASEFAEQCDGTLTEQATLIDGGATLEEVLDQIARSNDGAPPELLYYPLANEVGAAIALRARRTPGLEDAILAGMEVGEDGAVTPELLDGMYLSAPTLTPTGDFYESSFLDEYRSVSAHDDPIGAFHGQAYDAVNLVLDALVDAAIEEDGVLYIPRSALREAVMASEAYEGLTGNISCNADGECGSATIAVSLVEGGALNPVWP